MEQMREEVTRMEADPKIRRLTAQLDAAAGISADSAGWPIHTQSLVNYASAPIGAKKHDASTLAR
jgi:hypothetical protein